MEWTRGVPAALAGLGSSGGAVRGDGYNRLPMVRMTNVGLLPGTSSLDEMIGHIYGRNTNPTTQVFEEKIRLLEGAEAAFSTASGMAAVHGVLLSVLRSGGVNIRRRLADTLEVESGSNDPMAIFLTVGLIQVLTNAVPFPTSPPSREAASNPAVYPRSPTT